MEDSEMKDFVLKFLEEAGKKTASDMFLNGNFWKKSDGYMDETGKGKNADEDKEYLNKKKDNANEDKENTIAAKIKNKSYKCPYCTFKSFETRSLLEAHVSQVYTGLHQFKCGICKTPFKTSLKKFCCPD